MLALFYRLVGANGLGAGIVSFLAESVFCSAVFVLDDPGFVELFTEGPQLLQRAAMPCAQRRHRIHAEAYSSVAPYGLRSMVTNRFHSADTHPYDPRHVGTTQVLIQF